MMAKSRFGFVSNSSSSSFIHIKEGGKLTKENLKNNIEELAKSFGYLNTYESIVPSINAYDLEALYKYKIPLLEKEFEDGKNYSVTESSIENLSDYTDIEDMVKFFNGIIIWEDC